ncbi:hypothetical protein NDU88_007935 [Pleurodeles waltl]|uniref:Uncharacterized protein n=1 Tax=Pleurodeles waltl TaxID=8319 RepID=A0AAV7NCU2_PLEWA|nr:hypothetical protein NDU88_007935 [Pleurodeles waltl]
MRPRAQILSSPQSTLFRPSYSTVVYVFRANCSQRGRPDDDEERQRRLYPEMMKEPCTASRTLLCTKEGSDDAARHNRGVPARSLEHATVKGKERRAAGMLECTVLQNIVIHGRGRAYIPVG